MGQNCIRDQPSDDEEQQKRTQQEKQNKKGSKYSKSSDAPSGGQHSGKKGHHSTVQLVALEHMEHPQSRMVDASLLDKRFREFSRVFKEESSALAVAAVNGIPTHQQQLLCTGEDRHITLLNFNTGHILQKWESAHDRDINCLTAPHVAHSTFLSGSRDKTMKLWQLDKDDALQVFRGHELVITSIDMNSEGNRAVSGSRDNTVRLWDLERGDQLACIDIKLNLVHFVKWIPQMHLIAQGGEDLTVRLYDVRSEDELNLSTTMTGFDYHPICAEYAKGGTGHTLFTGHNGFNGQGSTVIEWDLRKNQQVRVHSGHQFTVRAMKLLQSKESEKLGIKDHLVTASDDGTVKFWDMRPSSWTEGDATTLPAANGGSSTPREADNDGGEPSPEQQHQVSSAPQQQRKSTLVSSHEIPEGYANSMDETDEGHIIMSLKNGCLLILKPGGVKEQLLPVQRFRYVGNPAAGN